MKKIFTIIAAVVLTVCCLAQAPQKMSYQAIIRDGGGTLVQSHAVGIRIQILQTSEFGAAVYVETHSTTTNANGLVTLEIGSGNVVLGTFASTNWADGPYFLKTETDPTGGTSYSITGTSQLLSVPYALYAKTADNVTGIVAIANGGTGATTVPGAKTCLGLGNVDNTTDLLKPISTATQTALDLKAPIASPAFTGIVSGISKSMVGLGNVDNTADLIKPISYVTQSALNSKAPLASPTFTGTPLATTATAGTNTTQIATTAFVTSALSANTHSIGESYGGGIVFYVYDNGQHGLIAATVDQSTGIRWYAGTYTYTMAKADGVGAGKANTAIIIANQGYGDGATYAARICNEYSVTVGGVTYGDWYLPSKFELNLLYLQKGVVGGFASSLYWSSAEGSSSSAWSQDFSNGLQANLNKSYTYYVRAVRAF